MSHDHSVTILFQKLRAGDPKAQRELWNRYVPQLVEFARKKLKGIPRRAADEEDVALSAFDAFFRGTKEDRFSHLHDRRDLWTLLTMITQRRALTLMRRELAYKRGQGKCCGESVFESGPNCESQIQSLADVPESQPLMAEALILEIRERIECLNDDMLRRIVICRLEGYSAEEIAEQLGVGLRTVERKLNLIRQIWVARGMANE